jgi:hypothetical protein
MICQSCPGTGKEDKMQATTSLTHANAFPAWVPSSVRHYLEHTESGQSIRALARAAACHPSTVLRQVRRVETRRDDHLVDAALKSLAGHAPAPDKGNLPMSPPLSAPGPVLTQQRIDQEARRILRRLCEPGAMLAAARDLDTAVVVGADDGDDTPRSLRVDGDIAQAMALKDWIACSDPDARIARYFITNTGRAALRRLLAESENRALGFRGQRAGAADADWHLPGPDGAASAQTRYCGTESPLLGLARRRGKSGAPYLTRSMVATGERLREDFELAQLGSGGRAGWSEATAVTLPPLQDDAPHPARAAHARLAAALADLGPGLGDVVLRCCCLLEGLEQTEKTMGWSARSGKIVLKIALDRLTRHYDSAAGRFAPMIG